MLKKYLKYYDVVKAFMLFALSLILCYTVSVTMYLSMPPENVHIYFVFRDGLIYLEFILGSFLITAIATLLLTYTFRVKT